MAILSSVKNAFGALLPKKPTVPAIPQQQGGMAQPNIQPNPSGSAFSAQANALYNQGQTNLPVGSPSYNLMQQARNNVKATTPLAGDAYSSKVPVTPEFSPNAAMGRQQSPSDYMKNSGMTLEQMQAQNKRIQTPAVPEIPTTSSGQTINPTTGGVAGPAVPPVTPDLGFQSKLDPNDPAAIGGAIKPVVPPVPPVPGAVPAPIAPTSTAVTDAETAYANSLKMSPEEDSTQGQLDTLNESYKAGYMNIAGQAIPMDFITGQQRSLEQRKLAVSEPLEARMARLQAKRVASTASSKFSLERADKAAEIARTTKTDAEKAKREGAFTLGEDQQRYDAEGKLVASGKAGSTTGKDTQVQKVGEDLYERQADGTWKKVVTAGGGSTDPNSPGSPQNILNSLIDLQTDSGRTAATGFTSVFNFIPGTDASTFKTKFDSVQALLALPNLGLLKGAMSDNDLRFIKAAGSNLKLGMGEEAFSTELNKIKTAVETGIMYKKMRSDPSTLGMTDDELRQIIHDELAGDSPKADGGADATNLQSFNIGGKDVKVQPTFAENLSKADEEFYRDTGRHLVINEAYRSNERQQELYDAYKSGKGGRAAPPGQSFHGKGLAVDVKNWQEAEKYLRKYGLKNDLADDKNHFSLGEFA